MLKMDKLKIKLQKVQKQSEFLAESIKDFYCYILYKSFEDGHDISYNDLCQIPYNSKFLIG